MPNVDQIQSLIDDTSDAWMTLPRVSAAWQMVDAMARYDQGMDMYRRPRSSPAAPIFTPDNVPSAGRGLRRCAGLRGPVEGTVGGRLIMKDTRSMELAPELRQLLDRQEIVDLLLRYASTIDAKDYAVLRSLFCDDIHARYGDVVVDGGDELLAWIDGMTADATWQHHMLNVYHVDFVSETEARTLTYHTSHQTTSDGTGHVPQDRRPVLRHGPQGRRRVEDRRQVHGDRLGRGVDRRPAARLTVRPSGCPAGRGRATARPRAVAVSPLI